MRRVLYFFSKTDTVIIRYCPSSTKAIQLSLGTFVLFTGLLAFFSGSYAISNMFIKEVDNGLPVTVEHGWLFAYLLGLLYASMITAIDREIVAATTKWAVVLRIPLAIIISLVVSVPIELQIFEGRIVNSMRVNSQNDRNAIEQALEQKNLAPLQQRLHALERQRDEAIVRKNEFDKAAIDEITGTIREGRTGKPGSGSAYREDTAKSNNQIALISKFDAEVNGLKNEIAGAKGNLEIEKRNNYIPTSFDLLSRYIALKRLKEEDKTGSATEMSLGVTILFLLFELIPSIMKLLLPKTEYDTMLEKRRLLNINSAKIIYQHTYLDYGGMTPEEIQKSNPEAVEKIYMSQSIKPALKEVI